jgi:hypothetical protein
MGDNLRIEALTFNNYPQWKQRFESVLVLKKLSAAIEGNGTPSEHKEALALMRLCVSDSILLLLDGMTDAKLAWDKLEQRARVGSVAKEMQLRGELSNLRLQPTESIDQYEERTRIIQRSLAAAGVKILDHELAQYMLSGVPPAYRSVTTVLVESATALGVALDLDNKVVPALKRQFLQLETEVEREGEQQGGKVTAFMMHGGGQRTVICWYCNKPGHVKADCNQRKRDAGKNVRAMSLTAL